MSLKKTKITVDASKEYDVHIGSGLLHDVGAIIEPLIPICKIAIITDDTVDKLYSSIVENSLEKQGYTVVKYVFPHGEQSKNIKTYADILNFLAENQLTRSDAVVALGGGVVGDMAGFASATYLRGIKYVQVPTTLLAQIDSSVGGKTAIDLDAGKNLVGAFCQPVAVVCDVDILSTLPKPLLSDGMGEMIKYSLLDTRVYNQLKKDSSDLFTLVALCVDYKKSIVCEDEFESGKRRLLNLGHTPAHGIEKLSNYSISHGTAVAMGVKIILISSYKKGLIDETVYLEISKTLNSILKAQDCLYTPKEIADACLSDKKRSGDDITLIMVYGIGDCRPVKIKVSDLEGYFV